MRWGRIIFAAAVGAAALAACAKDYASDEPQHEIEAGVDAERPTVPPDGPSTPGPSGAEAGAPLTVLEVELGDYFGCALLSDHSVWCWGDNSYGQLGFPPGGTGFGPQKVPIDSVASITAGGTSACAVKADTSLWCWGENTAGQLGHDPAQDKLCTSSRPCTPTPTEVPGYFFQSATIGSYNGCAITTTGSVVCWGRNNEGECGVPFTKEADGSSNDLLGPTAIAGLKGVSAVRTGYDAFNICALDRSHRASCWGRNTSGELGHNPGDFGDLSNGGVIYNPVPVQVQNGDAGNLGGVTDIATGIATCVVRTNGVVACFGRNIGNLLGLDGGDSLPHPTPVAVNGMPDASAIRVSVDACAIVTGGNVYCWGPSYGDIAPGAGYDAGCLTTGAAATPCTNPALVPGAVVSTLDVALVSAGGLSLDGGLPLTWGVSAGYNRLGHPDSDASPVALPVVGLP